MKRKRFAPEKIISMLREAEVSLSQGLTVGQVCRRLGISEQTYYRWRKQYGGMKISQARRMKSLRWPSTCLAAYSRHFSRKVLASTLTPALPTFFSTINSIGRPWQSQPGIKTADLPDIFLYFTIKWLIFISKSS
mgnify:CR=1 FL=1